jgi:uncharacterized protein (TIGR02611 family)
LRSDASLFLTRLTYRYNETMDFLSKHAKRVALEGLGWLLLVVGIIAIPLPGPGLIILFAGLALLSTQYEWAERRVEPVKNAALRGARQSVESWPSIIASLIVAVVIITIGVVWGLRPATPGWWPFADKWWLAGGWGTGATLIASGILALGILLYSFLNFRNHPAKH